jgi:hypothetical protein
MRPRGSTRYYPAVRPAIPHRRADCSRVTHPFATNCEEQALHSSFDLHVLSTPPAFVLSQDQTLRRKLLAHQTTVSSESLNRSCPSRRPSDRFVAADGTALHLPNPTSIRLSKNGAGTPACGSRQAWNCRVDRALGQGHKPAATTAVKRPHLTDFRRRSPGQWAPPANAGLPCPLRTSKPAPARPRARPAPALVDAPVPEAPDRPPDRRAWGPGLHSLVRE